MAVQQPLHRPTINRRDAERDHRLHLLLRRPDKNRPSNVRIPQGQDKNNNRTTRRIGQVATIPQNCSRVFRPDYVAMRSTSSDLSISFSPLLWCSAAIVATLEGSMRRLS